MIQAFYNAMGEPSEQNPEGLSAKTVKNVHGVLHKALQQAVLIGYLRYNPADACILPRIERKKIKPFDDAQITAFLAAIQGNRFETLFILTLFTGMREGEVQGLTWDCIDFHTGIISVEKQMQLHQDRGSKGYELVSPKNGRSRTIAVAQTVLNRLQQQRRWQMQQKLLLGSDWQNPEGLVFTNEFGTHLTKPTVYREYKRIVAAIGCPNARFHDLRHPYVKHTTKIFSLRLMDFRAQAYKFLSQQLLELLGEECRSLVYTVNMPDGSGPCLPYFGGVAGSNEFRDATAVICLGMPRVEPRVYLSRALAIDPDGSHMEELSCATEALERQPCVLDMQDHYLAHDLVQMAFCSRLRHHGDTTPVELWLTQPPDAVLTLLHDYFGDCRFEKHNALPSECHSKLHTSKQRNGIQTNAARLYEALLAIPEGSETTPAQLREQTGLTQDQYKEAMRAASVRELFRTGFTTFGSGKNQKIRRVSSKNAA